MKKLLSLALALLMVASLVACGGTSPGNTSPAASSSAALSTPAESVSSQQEPVDNTESKEGATPSITTGQSNALAAAKDYLDYAAFSYTGLIEQLEYEKYTNEEAVYAADNCGADWDEQAEKSAASYLDMTSFSRDGLIEQLEYEGFTHDQAVHGAEANGY